MRHSSLWPSPDDDPSGEPADRGLVLRCDGSGTVGSSLLPDLAEAYLKSRDAADVRRESTDDVVTVLATLPGATLPTRMEISTNGSAAAFSRLLDDSTDVGMSSRQVTQEEQQSLATVRGDMTSRAAEHILALDAVTVIVNSARDVPALTVEQFRGVHACEITDWSQLGPAAGSGPIRAIAFREGSGTLAIFEETVMGGQPLCPLVDRTRGVDNVTNEVAADPSSGTNVVDNRAFRNLDLFAQSMTGENQDRQVVLVGFADNAGSEADNQALSEARAASVAQELQIAGVSNVVTAGFGEALPVDTDDIPEGREQNRCVEVWLR